MKTTVNPFRDPAPEEIPLPDSPLVRVIAQVAFPAQLSLVERPTISEIQKAIGGEFPVLEEQNLRTFILNLTLSEKEGQYQPQATPETQWRFSNPQTGFVLQINTTSITFETSRYTSRNDFFERFRVCLCEIHRQVPLQLTSRLGVRYVDQVPDSKCANIHTMICEPFRGISGLPFDQPPRADLHDFLVPVETEKGVLHARLGFLPANTTIDPTTLPPIQERSWILDLDLFRQGALEPFNPDAMAADASAFALRIYTVFRWIVSKDFLRTFGGRV